MTFVVRRRQDRERQEHELLSPQATKADQSKGRADPEEPDAYRTDFERDRDRVIHSKAFRRLKHKTQVFLNPEGDHFVTRLTHTLQVMQVGRAMAVSLSLNETLTEAICLAHDVGHSPFGHVGEETLSPFVDGEWLHSAHGVRTLTVVEPLNLTWETLDGVRAHSWRIDPPPATPEGALCRFADRIAYLTHDVADAIRAGVLRYDDIPLSARNRFGATSREWIDAMITSVVETSARQGSVEMDPVDLEVMNELRAFMFERVYLSRQTEAEKQRAIKVIRDLVEHFASHRNEIPRSVTTVDAEPLVAAIDYVAGMTDRYAIRTHDRLFRPTLF
ncbi:MAG: HD domain-containing protein [Acidimicrobiia bacterium]|nr:HD domain-containing protein [Acidimicrobiia bacterium]